MRKRNSLVPRLSDIYYAANGCVSIDTIVLCGLRALERRARLNLARKIIKFKKLTQQTGGHAYILFKESSIPFYYTSNVYKIVFTVQKLRM